MAPSRLQRRRTVGWRKPERAVYVGRPTRFGNPARLVHAPHGLVVEWTDGGTVGTWPDEAVARRYAVTLFEHWIRQPEQAGFRDLVRAELAGRDLLCWCPLDQPCHADSLIRIANSQED
jgi:hypothetical protein